jgi:hypothetical protein
MTIFQLFVLLAFNRKLFSTNGLAFTGSVFLCYYIL